MASRHYTLSACVSSRPSLLLVLILLLASPNNVIPLLSQSREHTKLKHVAVHTSNWAWCMRPLSRTRRYIACHTAVGKKAKWRTHCWYTRAGTSSQQQLPAPFLNPLPRQDCTVHWQLLSSSRQLWFHGPGHGCTSCANRYEPDSSESPGCRSSPMANPGGRLSDTKNKKKRPFLPLPTPLCDPDARRIRRPI